MAIVRVTRGISEWVQRNFDNVGQDVQRKDGDYAESTGLVWDRHLRRLVPLPMFTDFDGLPTGYDQPHGVHYEEYEGWIRVMYSKADGTMACALYEPHRPNYYGDGLKYDGVRDLSLAGWSHVTGLHGQYAAGADGFHILIITTSGKLYKKQDDILTQVGTKQGFVALSVYGGTVFAIQGDGDLYKLNSGGTDFDLYLDKPASGYTIAKMFPHKQYLAIVAYDSGGVAHVLRVPDSYAQKWHEIALLDVNHNPGQLQTTGSNRVTVLGDDIYLLTASEGGGGMANFVLYKVSGSAFVRVATIAHEMESDLTLYRVRSSIYAVNGQIVCVISDTVYVLVGSRFSTWAQTPQLEQHDNQSFGMSYCANGFVFLFGQRSSDSVWTFWYSDPMNNISGGEVITSRLTMGSPGTDKHLHSITVLLDAEVEDVEHKTVVYYRVNADTAWTELTASGGDAGLFLRFDEIKVGFYLMQIRVVLNNSATGRTGISEISVTYTTP